MLKRLCSIGIVLIIGIIGFTQKEQLLEWIQAGGLFSILVSMLLVSIIVFVPVVPFPVLGGVIGAVFGIWQGVLISLAGAMIGTLLMFIIARYGFRDWAQLKLEKYPKVKEYESLLEKHSFFAILLSRVIPIVPSPVVNIVCGLSHVKWFLFFIASMVGKLPNILLISYTGAHFQENKWISIGMYGTYIVIIMLVNFIIIHKNTAKQQLKHQTDNK